MALLVITMNKRQVYVLLPDTIAIQWLLTPSRSVLIPRLLMGVGFLHTSSLCALLCAFDTSVYKSIFHKFSKVPPFDSVDFIGIFHLKYPKNSEIHTRLPEARPKKSLTRFSF